MPFLQAAAFMGNSNQGIGTGGVALGLQGVGGPSAAKSPWLVGVAGVPGQQLLRRVRARQDWDRDPLRVALHRAKPRVQASDEQLQGVTRQSRLCFAFVAAGFDPNSCPRMAKGMTCAFRHAAQEGSGDLASLYEDALTAVVKPPTVGGSETV
ncbi:hypothetical protein Vafri_4292 [Volvox africanus]|uniref:Uncharacterized protein n=1 Tax=Volvox africanus TaxID=51714 RepID=A0A8J4AXD1_9CHLO|nr:hypothetical protein Vafri_4292 [Volvox africanus]